MNYIEDTQVGYPLLFGRITKSNIPLLQQSFNTMSMPPLQDTGTAETSCSFVDQIKDWLTALGYPWTSGLAGNSDFMCFTIFRSEQPVMKLIIIDYEKWLLPDALDRYDRAFQFVAMSRLQGITSVLLWEDQWRRSRNIVVSRIKALLGTSLRIPGRLTYTARINKSAAEGFLNTHHLQGDVSSKYRYGLFLPIRYFRILPENFPVNNLNQDLLVAVATFSNAKIFPRDGGDSHRSCELIRFANHCDTTVVGGMNKMLKSFTEDFKPDDIMTYVDLEWSDGRSYEKLNFEYISERAGVSFYLDMQNDMRYRSCHAEKTPNKVPITNAGSNKFVKTLNL